MSSDFDLNTQFGEVHGKDTLTLSVDDALDIVDIPPAESPALLPQRVDCTAGTDMNYW